MFGLLERDSLENSLRPEHENGNNTGSRGAGKRIRCHIFVGTKQNACVPGRKVGLFFPVDEKTGHRAESCVNPRISSPC